MSLAALLWDLLVSWRATRGAGCGVATFAAWLAVLVTGWLPPRAVTWYCAVEGLIGGCTAMAVDLSVPNFRLGERLDVPVLGLQLQEAKPARCCQTTEQSGQWGIGALGLCVTRSVCPQPRFVSHRDVGGWRSGRVFPITIETSQDLGCEMIEPKWDDK